MAGQSPLAEPIRIEATRRGRFNPVFKEAPPASQGILCIL
jgi:hypothetical protein